MNKIVIVIFSLLMSSIAQAEFLVCGEKEIDRIQIQASREDNHSHANTLLLRFKDAECNNRKYAYISQANPMFDAMVSIALAAKVSGKKVEVIVNTNSNNGSASQISILGIIE